MARRQRAISIQSDGFSWPQELGRHSARPWIGVCAEAQSAAARLLLVAVWREVDWIARSPTGRDEVGRSGQGVIDA
jgi:hypothetical protein